MRDCDKGIMKYNIYEKSLNQVKKTVLDIFRGEDIQIILFGSRAR